MGRGSGGATVARPARRAGLPHRPRRTAPPCPSTSAVHAPPVLRVERAHPAVAAPGWTPSSPCTTGCLPPDGGQRAGRVRVAARIGGLVAVLLVAVTGAPLLPVARRDRWLRACSRAALSAAGVELRVTGGDRFGGALVVANHVSWIDVLALNAVQPVRMLAKREVRGWPLIGGLAERTGAVFVDRASLHALPATVAATAAALRTGAAVGVFPEGTTWCGGAAGPFHRAAFQAAIDAGAPVRPVAIAFLLPDGTPARAAAFVGSQSLPESVLRIVRLPRLRCEVSVLPPITGTDRRELAARAAVVVGAVTGMAHSVRPPARRSAAA
jgi:1-acyl-sn-glycerol-3-phosphate acyltransferase